MKIYPKITGSLCAKMDRGLSGQDGFNDMIPVIQNYTGGGIAATLDASYYKGAGSRNGKEREFICICWT